MRYVLGLVLALLASGCALTRATFHPPAPYRDCTVIQVRHGVASLSCPPKAYSVEPQLGYRLVEIDVHTQQVKGP